MVFGFPDNVRVYPEISLFLRDKRRLKAIRVIIWWGFDPHQKPLVQAKLEQQSQLHY